MSDSIESDDDGFDVKSNIVKKEPKKANPRKRDREIDSDEENSDDEPPQKKRKTAAPKKEPTSQKKAPNKLVAAKQTPSKAKAQVLFIDSGSEEEMTTPKKSVSNDSSTINTSRYGARKNSSKNS